MSSEKKKYILYLRGDLKSDGVLLIIRVEEESGWRAHRVFNNYWEAWAVKCQIDQGLKPATARWKEGFKEGFRVR